MKKKIKEYPKEVLEVIPKGMYCHGELTLNSSELYLPLKICPFWFKINNRKKQENGYCVLLGKGDYEMNREKHIGLWTSYNKQKVVKKWKEHYGPNNPDSSSLLWDQCKEEGCPKQ
jgi:hypothetical protein